MDEWQRPDGGFVLHGFHCQPEISQIPKFTAGETSLLWMVELTPPEVAPYWIHLRF